MNQEELLKRIEDLEKQNQELRKRLRKKNNHGIIKTSKKEIVDYWVQIQDECGLSVDWSEALERCWRCGYKANLQRCHIIPESLGGKDEPSNFVLLCTRCHIDAPNVESETFMWDWIRANGTSFYDTFWKLRARKEYEFVYGKSFEQELEDRDIVSDYDLRKFWNLKIGKSIHHFAHPWNNESTDAGLLRMRLEEFDKTHPEIKKKSNAFRKKEEDFSFFILHACELAQKYHWNVWEGRSQNPLSVTIGVFIDTNKKKNISIKLCGDNLYWACFPIDINPNNNRRLEYTIKLGTRNDAIKFLTEEIEKFSKEFGNPYKQDYVFTINPMYHLKNKESV